MKVQFDAFRSAIDRQLAALSSEHERARSGGGGGGGGAAAAADDADPHALLRGLSLKQRVLCTLACLVFGTLCDVLACSVFLLRPTKFAKLYTLGNVALLASTLFLVGPQRQLRNMAHPSRAAASLVFVAMLLLTLYCAVKLRRLGLTLVCVSLQTAAMVYYAASYIPFGQRCIRSTTRKVSGVLLA